MSIEYTAQELSEMRERQMIDVAVKRGLTVEDFEELETQAMAQPHRKRKSRPKFGTTYQVLHQD